MGNFLSKKKEKEENEGSNARERRRKQQQAKLSSKDKAVLDLKNARDRLKKYQQKLDQETQQLHQNARQLMKMGKKDRAKLALQMKKHKQLQIEKADAQLLNVLQMVDSVEWESQQLEVFRGLKAGTAVLDAIHQEMSVEAVEQLMEDTAEAQERANEISQLIGGEFSAADEDEILQELAAIEEAQEVDPKQALEQQLPQAPTTTPVAPAQIQVEEASAATPSKAKTKEPVLA